MEATFREARCAMPRGFGVVTQKLICAVLVSNAAPATLISAAHSPAYLRLMTTLRRLVVRHEVKANPPARGAEAA